MSCNPGTPCYTSTISNPTTACGIDQCNTTKFGTGNIFYTGSALSCSGISTCDSLTVALQKMDYALCNAIPNTITASNGLTKVADDIQLGGELIQQTSITTSFAYTLSLLGLVNDITPDYFITQTSSGVIRKSSYSDIVDDISSTIISDITANNGLTKTGNTIELGGTLISPTTIVTDNTNTLSITGLQTETLPDFFVTETTAGVVKKVTRAVATSLFASTITASNGLKKVSDDVRLGGTLIENTTVELDGYNLQIIDSTSPNKVSTIEMSGVSLNGTFDYISLGSNSLPVQKYGTAIGLNNNVLGGGQYGFVAGVSNTLSSGSASYAIGASNTVANGSSGAIGISNTNDGYTSHAIGYTLEIPSANIGTFQVGIFNNVNAVDYGDWLGTNKHPSFSVGAGSQSGESPAETLNIFHVLKNGFVKSKDGYDSRSGERGILPPQWSDTGWVDDTASETFEAGAKYIILQYVTGDDFSNLVDLELWGESNTSGYTFIGNGNTTPFVWTTSQVAKIGRPDTPSLGEMGFNLDANQMEYYNGTTWIQF